jgi:hypothetical protein
MRPLGHTKAKEAREECIAPLNERLFEAWGNFPARTSSEHLATYYRAIEDLAPIAFSRPDLDALILRTPVTDTRCGTDLGLFASAGMALLPERKITYSLETPDVHCIGYGLEKDLIITGTVGNYAGERMRGTFMNRGSTAHFGGKDMIGVLENHGMMGDGAGHMMAGSLLNYGVMGDEIGSHMIGTLLNAGTMGKYPGGLMLGVLTNNGTAGEFVASTMLGRYEDAGVVRWTRFAGDEVSFLHDIEQLNALDNSFFPTRERDILVAYFWGKYRGKQ